MEGKLNIYQKLLSIQTKINGLGKDKSAFNFKYVTGDKVLGEIKPLMNSLGLILKSEILSIDNTRQDYVLIGFNISWVPYDADCFIDTNWIEVQYQDQVVKTLSRGKRIIEKTKQILNERAA